MGGLKSLWWFFPQMAARTAAVLVPSRWVRVCFLRSRDEKLFQRVNATAAVHACGTKDELRERNRCDYRVRPANKDKQIIIAEKKAMILRYHGGFERRS